MSSSVSSGIITYVYDEPLDEMSEITVQELGEPDRVVTLGTLISMTNGDILDTIPESALA